MSSTKLTCRWVAVIAVLVAACSQSDDVATPVDGAPVVGVAEDAGPRDLAETEIRTEPDLSADSTADPAVDEPPADEECLGVRCPFGAHCDDGACPCDPFFTDFGAGTCVPQAPPDDLSSRTSQEVCAIWRTSHPWETRTFWLEEPQSECDPGVLHPDVMLAGIVQVSVFRMLVGLYPVTLAPEVEVRRSQLCATLMAANEDLHHSPPKAWACWTPDAAKGAAESNLGIGYASPADTVFGYMADRNTRSLGHRRWMFANDMGVTAFGHRDTAGCMWVGGGGTEHRPEAIAYPSPGPFPRDAVLGAWSIVSTDNRFGAEHTVTVTDLTLSTSVPVRDVYAPSTLGLDSALAWTVETQELPLDHDYQVTIRDGDDRVIYDYVTTLVDCSQ